MTHFCSKVPKNSSRRELRSPFSTFLRHDPYWSFISAQRRQTENICEQRKLKLTLSGVKGTRKKRRGAAWAVALDGDLRFPATISCAAVIILRGRLLHRERTLALLTDSICIFNTRILFRGFCLHPKFFPFSFLSRRCLPSLVRLVLISSSRISAVSARCVI